MRAITSNLSIRRLCMHQVLARADGYRGSVGNNTLDRMKTFLQSVREIHAASPL